MHKMMCKKEELYLTTRNSIFYSANFIFATEQIKRTQFLLNQLGYNVDSINGIYGSKINKALKNFTRIKMKDLISNDQNNTVINSIYCPSYSGFGVKFLR